MIRAQDVSQDNPAVLRRTSDDVEVRVTDPAEYQTLVYTAGYRDVTGEAPEQSATAQQAPAQPPARHASTGTAAQQQPAPTSSAPAEPS